MRNQGISVIQLWLFPLHQTRTISNQEMFFVRLDFQSIKLKNLEHKQLYLIPKLQLLEANQLSYTVSHLKFLEELINLRPQLILSREKLLKPILSNLIIVKFYRCLTKNQTALVQIKLEERACLELFSNYKALGRITIRDRNETLASGIIIELGYIIFIITDIIVHLQKELPI